MAIYSLHLGFISRSHGRSSLGFSAYISGSRGMDERTGVSFDYSRKAEVVGGRVLAPREAPSWMRDPAVLWNRVEAFEDYLADLRFRGGEKSMAAKEKFLNSTQTAQTVMGAIPLELSQDQAEACVEDFLTSRFVRRGLVAEYALHWDKGNPHFHALVTRRPLEGETFSQRKDRGIVSRDEHCITRKQWETVVNKHLTRAGHEARIDCRSNADRGSLFQSTEHEGWHAQRLAEGGCYSRIVDVNDQTRQKNIQIILETPEALIHEVSLKRATFTKRHVEDEIIRRVAGDPQLFSLLKSSMDPLDGAHVYDAHDMQEVAEGIASRLLDDGTLVHPMGENVNREKIFTSQAYKAHEEAMVAWADQLQTGTRTVAQHWIDKAISNREQELQNPLSMEQKEAIQFLCTGPDVRLLNGKAGTGKTTLLKAVAEAYAQTGYRVMGTSFQGKTVEIMETEIGIPCRTLDGHLYTWKQHEKYKGLVESGKLWGQPYLHAFEKMKALEKSRFQSKDVIIVDEANMISSTLWHPFLKEASKAGAKIIIVQDPAQIKSRDKGDVARLLAERYGYAETNEVMRQKIGWQREASAKLNMHQVLDGLKPYAENDRIHWFLGSHSAMMKLAQDYVAGAGTKMALAYTNEEVRTLNGHIRDLLKENGTLKDHHDVRGVDYATGDRIRFTRNDNHGQYVKTVPQSLKERFVSSTSLGVKNGTLGHILSIKKETLRVQLEDGRVVKVKAKDYDHFTHGYAMTINKSEGTTFDRTYVLPSRHMNPHTTLVAMTRHKYDAHVYAHSQHFVDFKDLVDTCSKGEIRDTLQDYHVSKTQQPYFDRVVGYKDLLHDSVTLREEIEGDLKPNTPLFKHPAYKAYSLCLEEKKRVAKDILHEWDKHVPFTRLIGLRKDVLEVEAGLRSRHLSDIEQRAQMQGELYKDLVKSSKDLWSEIQKTHPGSLGQTHPLYETYHKQKIERDGLAFMMAENPKLYAPFCKGKEKVPWQAVLSHAKAHKALEAENNHMKSLSKEAKQSFMLAKDYVTARNRAAALYAQVKDHGKRDMLAAFKEAKVKRDALALALVEGDQTKHMDKLTIHPEKLLIQATHGEIRRLVQEYKQQKNEHTAQKLLSSLSHASHYQLIKEEGVNVKDIQSKAFPQKAHASTDQLLEAAKGRYDRLARGLLGQENKTMSQAHTLRFGAKGALLITLSGPKAGLWHDFSTGEGGHFLSLIMRETKGTYKEAIAYLKDALGGQREERPIPLPRDQRPRHNTAETIEKLATVQSLFEKSQDITHTVAHGYLRTTRGITCPLPQDLRFLPKGTPFRYKGENKTLNHPALAAFARDHKGILLSVQMTRLHQDGTRARLHDGAPIAKTKYGMGKDGFVTLKSAPASNTVIIAEGVETALSLKQTGINATIVAAQGIHNIKNYKGPESNVIIASDNDDHKPTGTHKIIDKAKQLFRAQGKHVSIIKPHTPGQDFNDVLKEKGSQAVQKYLNQVQHETQREQMHGRER